MNYTKRKTMKHYKIIYQDKEDNDLYSQFRAFYSLEQAHIFAYEQMATTCDDSVAYTIEQI